MYYPVCGMVYINAPLLQIMVGCPPMVQRVIGSIPHGGLIELFLIPASAP